MITGIRRTLTIGAPTDEVLARWCGPDVQPRVFAHLAQQEGTDPAAWSTEILERDPSGVRWRTRDSGGSEHEGTLAVRPAPGDWGTETTLDLAGPDGAALPAAITSAAAIEALHRFKSLVETGEIPTLDRNPHASHTGRDPH